MKKKIASSAATLVVAALFALASSIPASASTTWSLGGRNCSGGGGPAYSGITSITKGNVTHTEAANPFVAQSQHWSGNSTWASHAAESTYAVTSANYVDATAKYVASTTCIVHI